MTDLHFASAIELATILSMTIPRTTKYLGIKSGR